MDIKLKAEMGLVFRIYLLNTAAVDIILVQLQP
jgi:hypothetical protein